MHRYQKRPISKQQGCSLWKHSHPPGIFDSPERLLAKMAVRKRTQMWIRSNEIPTHSETAGKGAVENDPTALKHPFVQVDAVVAPALESEKFPQHTVFKGSTKSPQNTVFKGSPEAVSKTLEEPEELFIDSLSPLKNLDEIEEKAFALLDSELIASPGIRTSIKYIFVLSTVSPIISFFFFDKGFFHFPSLPPVPVSCLSLFTF